MKTVIGFLTKWIGWLGLRFRGDAVFVAVLLSACLASSPPTYAQVVPSGDAGGYNLTVGAMATGYALGYGDRKMLGIAAVADLDTKRRTGFEGEAQWLVFHQTANVHTTTWLVGPRYHLTFGRIQPYAKVLVGFGQFNYPYNLGQDTDLVIAPGGGVDYRINRRVRIRLADFEYQFWPQFHYGALSSYGVSSGIRIRIF
jgi:hypothetical protein